MVVNLFFYSAKCAMNFSVVGFVFFADFANERHQHSEAATDASHHNLSVHVITTAGRLLRRQLVQVLQLLQLLL